ncbi:uncharacterized protein VP01_742g2 [Puccinia sorghi]|uniref:DDE Tnp4 domain-containing protein n=1 Tax=Puccinia sorghi TaxID=27349 RepID=A0A0L6UCI9_9BASI|nr:uncharacterized protein VP01_742g2 [Puccinia sorghi]
MVRCQSQEIWCPIGTVYCRKPRHVSQIMLKYHLCNLVPDGSHKQLGHLVHQQGTGKQPGQPLHEAGKKKKRIKSQASKISVTNSSIIRNCETTLYSFPHPIVNRYSISLTLVCDIKKKFTSYLAAYPGSYHNSYVFSNMQIAQQPEKFFDQNQFLLADSAYKSDWFTLPSYKALRRKFY